MRRKDVETRKILSASTFQWRYVKRTISEKQVFTKFEDDWTMAQSKRATILFEKYPTLKSAYESTLSFRSICKNFSKSQATTQFNQWKEEVTAMKIDEFNTVVNSIEYHLDNILNFFDSRSTNANAESFNSKIKGFRANLRDWLM